jgi:hypothetical protein
MSRKVKILLPEYAGDREFLLIYSNGTAWEPEWEPLRGTEIGALIPVVPKEVLEWALKGYTKPLSKAMGVPPEGCLIKVPKASRVCRRRNVCPLHTDQCHVGGKNMPWCMEPDGILDDIEVSVVAKVIEQWRAGVYVVVCQGG